MNQVWRRDEIESPCVQICVMHPEEKICLGCYRSIEEISAWSGMTPDLRSAIMADLPERKSRLKKRRGGRAGRVRKA
ncbi:putative Fe-S protein [Thalassovita autumnalis]|jgi:hypothetical protein|uniref:Fe-S protein n=1 Tax=Thalassovita autumnalis TaxID=2072972 RepID=A0A0P1FQ16_9RHOB|nr:DUF1289 domain-containing protein [Thalassovita autumnalis]CUH65246.1 putative Fe-S protein [Thalassovita autumnalis]CUH70426.1 putative Fe-S protein [Thalassovita autumnalis]